MKAKFFTSLIVIVSILSFTGCYEVDSDFISIRNITLKECGKNFVTDTEFSLGSFELWLAEGIAGIADADDIALEMMDDISGIQIGVYKRQDNKEIPTKNLFKQIDKQLSRKGLHYIVKSYKKNEVEVVYVNNNDKEMFKELFVIKLDENELSIVQVSGDLEKVIETAIREEGLKIGEENSVANR